jgi:hypothetical protein
LPRRRGPVEPAKEWELRFATNRVAKGWADLKAQFPNPLRDAYDAIASDPRCRTRPRRQWPLKGQLATRTIGGRTLEQWQYEVTGAARIWYCPDDENHVVWVTHAAVGHPKATE